MFWHNLINNGFVILTYELVLWVYRRFRRVWMIRRGLRWECDRCSMSATGSMKVVDLMRKNHYELVPWHEFGKTD